MCGGNDACDHPHDDNLAIRAGEITRRNKIFTESISKQKILFVSVFPLESRDTEISVVNTFLETKIRKNFIPLHVHPEYKSYSDRIHYNERTYQTTPIPLLEKMKYLFQ